MYHGDPSHRGLSQSMPNVSGSPRVTESIKLDGAVYASPIAVDGVIVVATENGSVYAFDAQGRQLWHVKRKRWQLEVWALKMVVELLQPLHQYHQAATPADVEVSFAAITGVRDNLRRPSRSCTACGVR